MQQFGLAACGPMRSAKASDSSSFAGATARTASTSSVARAALSSAVDEGVADAEAAAPPFDPSKQVGAIAPLGFFDPLGFTSKGDEKGFFQLREAEIKHGRVAMMASIGLIGQHYIQFPGFEKYPKGFGILGSDAAGWIILLLVPLSGLVELAWRREDGREAGNYGDPFGVKQYTEDMRNREISNGRFAMICVLGIAAAELVSGKDAMQQFGFP